ncbi:hypothetical protein LEMA_P056110.1 [Plenodomus lingam JN3]|uniref:SET domain-containing protein n=1 Tax=Leptosphaeria maculans (strain JN3 / isolate v23.1.3 / race Av1-4-5-6-7-8) TaxID=985895 RepID=E4ZMN6_LEPMJ|nr:hypothetical protein LEMA_P056110.1 [Plenodomus lingam JN3]CBX92905.1 hypothetical protein LEMA_P056110.1 [Plenodomus lingam JN3]
MQYRQIGNQAGLALFGGVSFSKFNTHIFHRQVPRAPSLSIDVCRNQRLGGPGLSLVDLVLTSHVSTPQVLAPKEAEHLIESENCWHDYPLLTVQLSCHLNGIHEMAHPVQTWPKEQEENFPWSHTPICTPSLPSLNSPLCVYTSTTFASGRGLSIFTTPNLANHFASLPVFHNASILAEQDINGDTGTWRTETIPGKGIGMVASHTLDFGDRVTSYTPAFLAVLEDELGTLNREKWWRIAISQLPDGKDGEESVKDKFMGLATVYGDERVKVQDIVKANTFQLEVQGINHLAVWPETSRLNHDCGPKYVLFYAYGHPP